MASATLPAVRIGTGLATTPSRVDAITDAMENLKALRTFVQGELREGLDFGTIPGTGKKSTLLLPGAQKIGLYFNVCPKFAVKRTELGDGHLEVFVKCRLVTRSTRETVSEGLGSCSTMESKYRTRNAARVCPACGQERIIKGKDEYGGGWLCFKKNGGCGAKFRDGDPAIEGQAAGKVANDEIWDQRNTVLKMAKKRAQVDASLNLGAMSEMFTQDVEDLNIFDLHRPPEADQPAAPPAADPKAEVNEAFPQRQPRAQPVRQPERPRQEPTRAASESWASWSSRTLKEANDAWRNQQAVEMRLHPEDRTDLDTNAYRLNNALVTAAVATEKPDGSGPLVVEANVLNPDGKRDREQVKACAEWLFAEHRDWAAAETRRYLDGKRAGAFEKARPLVEGDDLPEPGSDG